MVSKGHEMKIACSWCRKEGKRGVLGEKAPLDDVRETHGICGTHRREAQALWQSSRLVTAGSKASHDPGMLHTLSHWVGLLKAS
jgi:hypothetical protein